MSLLLRLRTTITPPEDGPSGGAAWLRGYTPRFDYRRPATAQRRRARDEILILF